VVVDEHERAPLVFEHGVLWNREPLFLSGDKEADVGEHPCPQPACRVLEPDAHLHGATRLVHRRTHEVDVPRELLLGKGLDRYRRLQPAGVLVVDDGGEVALVEVGPEPERAQVADREQRFFRLGDLARDGVQHEDHPLGWGAQDEPRSRTSLPQTLEFPGRKAKLDQLVASGTRADLRCLELLLCLQVLLLRGDVLLAQLDLAVVVASG